ncbi:hypothetical protein EOD39_14423 [Acipenser ruthenus]|uniref:Uncharacterized protein n=1 Tax=Acipenser ruthenus TaxID=7906 RepID=A0A662YL52_ACIRT|nr:hypothetical protein EOD39_14423 [Acipenser ruthenus]
MEPPNCKEEKEHSAFSITKPDTQHNREDTAKTASKQVNVPNLSHLGRELEGHLFKEAEEEDVDFKFSDLCAKNDPWEASKTDPKGSDEELPTQQDNKQNMNFSEAFDVHPEVLTDQNTSDECENEYYESQKQGQHFLNVSHLTKEEDSPSNYKENEYERVLSNEQLTIEDVIMELPNCKEEKEHSAFSITKPDTQHNREDTAKTAIKQVNVPNLSHLGRELEGHLFKEAEEEDVDFKFSDLCAKNDPWEASKTDPKGSDEELPTQQDNKQNMNFSEAFDVHPEVLTDQNTSDECENEYYESQKQGQHFLNVSHLTKEEDSPSNYKENEYERVLSNEQLTIEGKPSQNDRMEDNRLITANTEDVTEEEDVDQQKGFFNPDDNSRSNPPSEFGNDSGDSFEFSDSFNNTEYGNLLDFNLAQQLKTPPAIKVWPPFGESTSCILNPNQALFDLQDNLDGSAEKPNNSLLQAPSNNALSPKGVDDVYQLDTMFPELDYKRYDYTTGSKVGHSEQQVSKETTLENVLINQEALDVYSPVPAYNRDTDTSVEQWPDKDDKSSKEFEIPVSSTGFSADDWIVFDNPGFAESDWSTTWKSLPQSPVVQINTDVVEDQETFVPSDIAGNSDIQTSKTQNEDDILTNSSPVTETDLRTEDDHATKLLAIQPFKFSKTELFPTQPCDWLLTIEPSANPRDNSTTKHLHDKHSVTSAEDETESEKKLPHSKQKLDWAKGGFFVQKKKVIDNFTPAFHPSLKTIVKTSSPSKEYTESITTQVANMTFTSLVKKNEDTPAHTNTFLTDAYSPELSSETVLSTVRYTEQNRVPVFNEGSNETVKYQDSPSKENISTDNGQDHAGEQGCRIYNPMTDYPITLGDEAFAENLTATRTKTTENSNVTFVLESSNDEGSEA